MKRTVVFTLFAVFVLSLAATPIYAVTFTTYDNDRSGFDTASGPMVTELNFDELANYAEVTDVYAGEGVVFSSLVVSASWSGVSPDYPTARAGAGSLSGSNPVSYEIGVGVPWDSSTRSELYVEFASPTNAVGAYFIDNISAIEVHIFDVNNVEILTASVSPGSESGDSGEWWGVVADEGVIARMTFIVASYGDFFAIDNFVFQPVILVDVDIKPGSCPNPFNAKSKGSVPVAIVGTEDFDVNTVDPTTLKLAGVDMNGIIELVDSTEPHDSDPDADECEDCSEAGPDGFLDLVVKFDTQELAAAIGEVDRDTCVELILTGELLDGTSIIGSDSVITRNKIGPALAPSKNSLTTLWGRIRSE